jgi:hypothetical protein
MPLPSDNILINGGFTYSELTTTTTLADGIGVSQNWNFDYDEDGGALPVGDISTIINTSATLPFKNVSRYINLDVAGDGVGLGSNSYYCLYQNHIGVVPSLCYNGSTNKLTFSMEIYSSVPGNKIGVSLNVDWGSADPDDRVKGRVWDMPTTPERVYYTFDMPDKAGHTIGSGGNQIEITIFFQWGADTAAANFVNSTEYEAFAPAGGGIKAVSGMKLEHGEQSTEFIEELLVDVQQKIGFTDSVTVTSTWSVTPATNISESLRVIRVGRQLRWWYYYVADDGNNGVLQSITIPSEYVMASAQLCGSGSARVNATTSTMITGIRESVGASSVISIINFPTATDGQKIEVFISGEIIIQ